MGSEYTESVFPRSYWTKYLDEVEDERHSVINLFRKPASSSNNEAQEIIGKATESLLINESLYKLLQDVAQESGTSMEDILLFSWHTVLGVFAYSSQTVVGIEISLSDKDTTVRPHLLKLQPEITLQEMIGVVKSRTMELNNFKTSWMEHEARIASAIDNLLVFREDNAIGLTYPLVVRAIDLSGTMSINIDYNNAVFKSEDIRRLLVTIEIVLQQVAKCSSKLMQELAFISEVEQSELQSQQKLNIQDSLDRTILDAFDKHVLERPHKIALIYEDKRFTYEELDVQANKLANYIMGLINVEPDTVIAFCLNRSELVIITMLGIWRTGGAYISIDPTSPDERNAYILNDGNAKLVLTDNSNFEKLKVIVKGISTVSEVKNLHKCNFSSESHEKPRADISIRSLAYIVYTSGTTGCPKGVLVEHGNLANDCRDFIWRYDLEENEVVMALCYHGFAAFVIVVSMVFGEGLSLILPSQNLVYDPNRFYEYVSKNGVTEIDSNPSIIGGLDFSQMRTLKRILLVGEGVKKPLYDRIRSSNKSIRIYNAYGSSEITICLTAEFPSFPSFFHHRALNKYSFVLNRYLQCTPVGAIGELCVTGLGVARGYLNQDKLSSQVFIKNPFGTEGFEKMFRTGDFGRRLADGSIEYIGRRDCQVSIRGFRVELGEIEAVICTYPGVTTCTVLAKSNDAHEDCVIIAYVIGTAQVEESNILDHANKKLPYYMIPTHVVKLNKFPLNSNGKVNRAELLQTPIQTGNTKDASHSSETESLFRTIWEEELGLPKGSVGINDSFFSLGGNSLLAVKAVNRLNKAKGTFVPTSHMFENKTVESFLKNFPTSADACEGTTIEAVSRDHPESLQLSFQQERLWVWNQFADGLTTFNVPIFFKVLSGFSLARFNIAVKAIVRRHEVLRTFLKINDYGIAYQAVSTAPLVITASSIQKCDLQAEFIKFIASEFDLSNEFPIRVTAFEVDNELMYIGMLLHHIAFDVWSRDIMLHELCYFYCNGDNSAKGLPELQIQYIDYAQNQRSNMTGTYLEEQISYWTKALHGYEVLRLPHDRLRVADTAYFSGKYILLELDGRISNGLRALGVELDVSLYSVLLACFFLMLHTFTKQDDIMVGTPLSCRNYNQIDKLIGFFMSALPLRQKIDSDISVQTFIHSVFNTVTLANKYQSLPPEKLMEAIGHTRDPYKDRDLCNVFFQVNESAFDETDADLGIPLRLYTEAGLLSTSAYDLDLIAVLNVSNPTIQGIFVYPEKLFNEVTVASFKDSFISVLAQFAGLQGNSDSLKLNQLDRQVTVPAGKHRIFSQQLGVRNVVNNISGDSTETNYTPPVTDNEEALCKIWAEALGTNVKVFGVTDDFFLNGGNGLIGTKVLGIMKSRLGIKLTLKELYLNSTVERVIAKLHN